MARKSFMPGSVEGIGAMLDAFDLNINANNGALAAKYGLTTSQTLPITQARMVWDWFLQALASGRQWSQKMTAMRDMMLSAPQGPMLDLPGGPALPPVALMFNNDPPQLQPGFFALFSGVVASIKNHAGYDVADGTLLGIEGPVIPPPDPAIVPVLTGDLFTSGVPELTCQKGQFEGYDVYLTRPGQAKRLLGFSSARRYHVTEPLPPAGAAEIWTFEVQYRLNNAPFGQRSQPLNLTVRGV